MPKLDEATARYWGALTPEQESIAYRDVLLCGGEAGYGHLGWRSKIVRVFRRIAFWIEAGE